MAIRINKVIKEFGIGRQTVVDFLNKQGHPVASDNPNEKLDDTQYELLKKKFGADKDLRDKTQEMLEGRLKRAAVKAEQPKEAKATPEVIKTAIPEDQKPKLVVKGKIDLSHPGKPAMPAADATKATAPQTEAPKPETPKVETPAASKAEANPAAPASEEPKPAAPAPAQQAAPAVEKPKAVAPAPAPKSEPADKANAIGEEENGVFKLNSHPEITGPKVVGTIDLNAINQSTRPRKRGHRPAGQGGAGTGDGARKKRQRIGGERVDVNNAANQPRGGQGGQQGGNRRGGQGSQQGPNGGGNRRGGNNQGQQGGGKRGGRRGTQPAVNEEDVAKQVKETLARLTNKQKGSKGAKYRKEKREQQHLRAEEERREAKAESKVLKLTEFVTANELAQMMDVPVTKVIATCMSIGIMVSINQRMDAETIDLVAGEFGFKTEYVAADVQEAIAEEADAPEDLVPRAPIVTVMGHVDHGKTSLLDHIRKTNVIAGEAGGITQHIGAYNVTLENGRKITFLDTPGHEAFTAMRARGAQVTDIAIIIIAADDDIMPQTKEAISHAVAANVPIVFAINKVDKPHANPDKIKEGLAAMNFLVEEWGGKYQSQDISAKKGTGVNELLEKVLLEADMLELKANPNRKAVGTVIESSLDKGRGYVATILVSNGTLHVGDIVLAGTNFGRVKALFNERGQRIDNVGPSMAATLLGFNGAPQAGDQFHVMDTEQEAREIANKREQLQREQDLRTREVLTLEKIGKRLKMGSYHELNIIVKADVDGSVEALADSFIKLSTEQIVVKVIYKGVGQISENDVTLAAASEAIIVGFQVRPSQQARKLAERDGVEIRQYSVIYDAIEDVKEAMEGMLEPVIKEEFTANIEVRQVYNISKVGLVAGAYVIDGKVTRTDKARLIREGIVIFTGDIKDLKRFKDDVKEVSTNFECGISLAGCNDIKEGDIIETFREVEVKQKLK